jgi:Xaa-Pro aminopeptidase
MKLEEIKNSLKQTGIQSWLFYDFQGLDPLAVHILGLSPKQMRTRRWFYFVPKEGDPVKLAHRIEPEALEDLPGEKLLYSGKIEMEEILKEILSSVKEVAMQYSPKNAVPYISRVDAGTLELIRSFGVNVVSSGDLIQILEAVLSKKELESHRKAASFLFSCVQEGFHYIASALKKKESVTELSVQEFILNRMKKGKFVSDHPPIVAVNAHTANPHYSPDKKTDTVITENSLVLLDMWCKSSEKESVYADITWTGYIGEAVPKKILDIFTIVRDARNKGIDFIRGRILADHPVIGYEVDEKVRHYIDSKGYGGFFIHRTGHSIGREVHWIGANLDNFETVEQRTILPGTCFSVEPGIYLKEFGIRSELDVYVDHRHLEVNPQKLQDEMILVKDGRVYGV